VDEEAPPHFNLSHTMSEKIKALEAEISALRHQIDEVTDKFLALKKAKKEGDKEVDEARQTLKELKDKIAALVSITIHFYLFNILGV